MGEYREFSVIYEDESVLVLDKPAGLIVQKSHTHQEVTLEDILKSNGLERGGLVHRLDRDTSGVMMVAKTTEAQEELQRQFRERLTDKEYLALVWGKMVDEHAVINAPIARHPKLGYKYVVMQEGREAKTEFWRQAEYQYGDEVLSLLKVKLYTGRTHQVRVHMMAMGHALVGDPVYGRRKDKTEVRQFLHAAKLGFDHPVTGERMEFEAVLPEELQGFLDGLERVE